MSHRLWSLVTQRPSGLVLEATYSEAVSSPTHIKVGQPMEKMLGNVVISKKNPRHTQDDGDAYKRVGRVCPCTLVDRKRKRYDNAVDVVVRLHDPTDPSTERTTPPCSAHVQLGDVP